MLSNEIPLGKRPGTYRFFEMLPAILSIGALLLVFILPLINPRLAAYYVLAVVAVMLFRVCRGSIDLLRGHQRYRAACRVDWNARLMDLSLAMDGRPLPPTPPGGFGAAKHREAIARFSAQPTTQDLAQHTPHPANIVHAILVAAYNEPFDVIAPTLRALVYSSTPASQIAVFFAFEERGGPEMEVTTQRLQDLFGDRFGAFVPVCHPRDIPQEIAGKGSNITYAGYRLAEWVHERGIDPSNVLVTTLDCDNRPHDSYFDNVAYEYILAEDRERKSYQPVSLYLNNIWDAPAPTRVIAAANSFWNLICTVRPMALRNFASHTQPLSALIDMDFWSKRTIVEDGHQYWRSYFHFRGDYGVVPIHVPIFQDAVLAGGFRPTLVAQYKQLSRWSYGASDVPFVAVRVFNKDREVPLWGGIVRFFILLDSHVSLAAVSVIIAIGGWLPFLITQHTQRPDSFVEHLPLTMGIIQQGALGALLISLLIYWHLLPPRPTHYPRSRRVGMVLQWLLFPITLIAYNSSTALYSQLRLLFGRYREKFDVTEKEKTSAKKIAEKARGAN